MARLVQLCRTLGCSPQALLANVWVRMVGSAVAGTVTVHLARLVTDPAPSHVLTPLHRWARVRLAQPDSRPELTLGLEDVEHLALLCRLDAVELYRALRPYTSRPALTPSDALPDPLCPPARPPRLTR